jgi:hypothetical protein
MMDHTAGNFYRLDEGNICGGFTEDDTHGTHDQTTHFRNYCSGWYPPYNINPNPLILNYGQGNRFTNDIGNVYGSPSITVYQQLFGSGGNYNYVYGFDPNPSVVSDPLVQSTNMRWANYDTVTGATRYCGVGASGFTSSPCNGSTASVSVSETGTTVTATSTKNPGTTVTVGLTSCSPSGFNGFYVPASSGGSSFTVTSPTSGLGTGTCTAVFGAEVPTVLQGNQSPLNNAVPSTTTLPCSFFLNTFTSTTCTPLPTGGTGLSFWKVCKTWTTFPTACATTQTPPFPPIGPDVTGGTTTAANFGSTPGVGGHANDIPASLAYLYLPIDTTYQSTYCIASSSWTGGTETLNLGTNGGCAGGALTAFGDVTHVMGGLQISGSACATSGAGTSTGSEVFITLTGSTTQIQYALASNPGSCAGGNILFPDVRQFDERVYETDNSSASFSCSPATVPANHSGNITETCMGSGTSWTGSTSFSISGVTGASLVSSTNNSATSQTIVINTGSGTGTLTISDTTDSISTTITVATAGVSCTPTSGAVSTTPSLTCTGTNTLWSSETASTLLGESGGSGASLGAPTVSSNTALTVTLTVGSATGTLTITDNSTTATTTFTATSGAVGATSGSAVKILTENILCQEFQLCQIQ